MYWLRGIVWVFLGFGIFLFAKVIANFLASFPPWITSAWYVVGVGFATVLIALGILDFVVGSGLLALKTWALKLAILLSAIHLLIGIGTLVGHPLQPVAVLSTVINFVVVVYLLLPQVRALFR